MAGLLTVPCQLNHAALTGLIPEAAGYPSLSFAIQVLTFEGDRLAQVTTFANPSLFSYFDLPSKI
ncbi:MAG: hypothetical protein AB1791_08915 [Chloroflexota bacterium]